jgi:GT2 family glycosyltransferase
VATGLVDLEDPGLVRYPSGDAPPAPDRVRLLARRGGRPAGFVEFDVREWDRLSLDERCLDAGLTTQGPLPWVPEDGRPASLSVVICTRERPDALRRCLASVLTASRGRAEIIVVDNAPLTTATRELCAGFDVRYVCEPEPGLSAARNAGVREAAGAWVAFTDDDVVVDPGWIDQVLDTAARGGDCVTGLIAPARLETRWQHYFEAKVPWGRHLTGQSFDAADARGGLFPLAVGEVGAGANFAVSAEALHRVGAFDERLGAGSRARGGEDLDYFFRLLDAGFRIVYEPAVLVWHFHRGEAAAFRRQIFGYGAGLGAYAAKRLRDRRARATLARCLPAALARLARLGAPAGDDPQAIQVRMPLRYRLLELAGVAAGFRAYLRRP